MTLQTLVSEEGHLDAATTGYWMAVMMADCSEADHSTRPSVLDQ
jgi:hypothetical protein